MARAKRYRVVVPKLCRCFLIGIFVAVTTASACRTSPVSDDHGREDGWVDIESDALVDDATNPPVTIPDEEDERVVALVSRAHARLEQGDTVGAHELVAEALTIDNESGLAHLERALIGQHVGDDENQIRADFQKARVRLPESARAHHLSGTFEEQAGNIDAARACFQDAIRLRPEHAEARLRLGRLLIESGDVDGGIAHLEESVRLSPTSVPVILALADAHERRGDHAKAERSLLSVIELSPDVPSHRLRLIAFYRRTNQIDKERKAQSALEKIDPRESRRLRKLKPSKR